MESLTRIVEILDRVSENESGISLEKLVKESNISKTSLYRITESMVENRVLYKDEMKRFYLGSRVYSWFANYRMNNLLLKISIPILQEIHDFTSETIHLFEYRDGEAFYIYKIDCIYPLSIRSSIGTYQPLYSTAGGKAILGSLNEEKLSMYLENHPLEKRTPNTITDQKKLKENLLEGKQKGYFLEIEENELGIMCIAVPIMNIIINEPIGAISVTIPTNRAPNKNMLEKIGEFLKKKADELENLLWRGGRNG